MKRRRPSVEEHPRGSGRYRVRTRIDGKLKTLSPRGGCTAAEAEEIADAYLLLRKEETFHEGITLAQFGEGFLNRRELAGVRGIRTDRASWGKHIGRDALGALAVATLTRRDIVEWRDRRKGAHRSRVRQLNLLRVALDEAVDRELLPHNPARDVKIHRSGAARAHDELEGILTPTEQHALMQAVPERYRGLVAFALCTGLRQAEQWWLTWDNVFGDRVEVRKSTGGLPPKSGKPREVYLLGPARAAVEGAPRDSRFVFPASNGERRQEGKAPFGWRSWVRAAGITRKVRWHDLRHTCATSLLAGWWGRKWSLDEVSKMLGHGSVQVTERYARKLNETLRLAVAATPDFKFPTGNGGSESGNGTAGNLPPAPQVGGSFVKHRSSVQSRLSAPLDPAIGGELRGTVAIPARDALALAAEALRLQGPRRPRVHWVTARRPGKAKRDAS